MLVAVAMATWEQLRATCCPGLLAWDKTNLVYNCFRCGPGCLGRLSTCSLWPGQFGWQRRVPPSPVCKVLPTARQGPDAPEPDNNAVAGPLCITSCLVGCLRSPCRCSSHLGCAPATTAGGRRAAASPAWAAQVSGWRIAAPPPVVSQAWQGCPITAGARRNRSTDPGCAHHVETTSNNQSALKRRSLSAVPLLQPCLWSTWRQCTSRMMHWCTSSSAGALCGSLLCEWMLYCAHNLCPVDGVCAAAGAATLPPTQHCWACASCAFTCLLRASMPAASALWLRCSSQPPAACTPSVDRQLVPSAVHPA